MKYWTSVQQWGNYLYVRGIDNGQRFSDRIEFHPTIWIHDEKRQAEDVWHTLEGMPLFPVQYGNIKETRQYLEVSNAYTTPGNIYQYIADNFEDNIKWDIKDLLIVELDIETQTEYGFPDPQSAAEELLLITIKFIGHDQVVTFGRNPYTPKDPNVKYVYCHSEQSLIREFLHYWQSNYPDAITGWNTSLFDNTYLYNRIVNVFDKNMARKLSPWGIVNQREVNAGNIKGINTKFYGIANLDYLDLYKKFTYSKQESYKLDYIASVELDERKLENPGATFKEFYTNYWETFVDYNIRDVMLIDKMDSKMKLIDLALTMAYDARVNYEDVFSPVKTWDVIIFNYLYKQKIVIPRLNIGEKKLYQGAYVKDPLIGKHKWVCSFDLNSLYPHLILQYNMSPETLTNLHLDVTVDELLEKKCNLQPAYDNDYAVAANGWCFKRDKKGLLPTFMQLYYDRRVIYKKEMLKAKQQYEETNDQVVQYEISRLNNLQMAMKILLNSAYGAFGNNAFRYFNVKIAEGITMSGQLSIRWIANRLNDFMNKSLKTDNIDRIVLIDTDSVVLSLEDLVEKVCPDKTIEEKIKYMDKVAEKVIQPFIDQSYQELANYMNAYEQKMVMKRENLVDAMISIAKKHYFMSVYNSEGVQYHEPKLKVMGLDMIKSSTPSIIRKKLKSSLKTILYDTEQDVQKFVSDYRTEFYELPVEDIAFPRGVSDVEKWEGKSDNIFTKGTPIHVRGALLYNYHVKRLNLTHKYPLIQNGEKIKFVYLTTPNPIGENCIAFIDKLPVEFDLHRNIDYDKMFEKVFCGSIQNVIDCLGWNTESISTLEDWFE